MSEEERRIGGSLGGQLFILHLLLEDEVGKVSTEVNFLVAALEIGGGESMILKLLLTLMVGIAGL